MRPADYLRDLRGTERVDDSTPARIVKHICLTNGCQRDYVERVAVVHALDQRERRTGEVF